MKPARPCSHDCPGQLDHLMTLHWDGSDRRQTRHCRGVGWHSATPLMVTEGRCARLMTTQCDATFRSVLGRQLPVCIKPKQRFYQFLWNYTFQVAVPLEEWRGKREKSPGVPQCLAKKFRAAWCSPGRQEDPLNKPMFCGQWDGSVGRGLPSNLMTWVLPLSLQSKRRKSTPVSSLLTAAPAWWH